MRENIHINKAWPIGIGITVVVVVVGLIMGIYIGRQQRQDESVAHQSGTTSIVDPSGVTEPSDPTRPTAIVTPDVNDVVCQRASVFTGPYVEDGKDAPVTNVAAILVTNPTDRYLDLASIVYEIDGKRATFKATGLPPGKSAWVMESSMMTVDPDAEFLYVDQYTVYRDKAVSSAEEVTFRYNGSTLQAVNNTDRALENVFVYYKVVHKDGNYLGGITYAVNFGNIMPGQTAEKIAGHYKEGWTEIVHIGWQESTAE